jgi:two-component system, OmpR family, sensor histidine kinase TctE
VGYDVQSQRVSLAVSDNGAGLAPEIARDLRQRWTRGQGSDRLQGGAGLGLAIVSRYADLLGATFTLSKAPDLGGLCATLGLVAAPDAITVGASPAPSARSPG